MSQSSGSNRSWLEGGSGSAIGGWALNALTGQRDYNRQLEMLGFENSFNAEQAQLARDFDERMTRESWARADSSYQRAVSDLKAAGLSPALALSVGGAPVGGMSGTSSAARSSSPTSQSSGQGLVSLISSVLGGFARIAATSINASSASNRAVLSESARNARQASYLRFQNQRDFRHESGLSDRHFNSVWYRDNNPFR